MVGLNGTRRVLSPFWGVGIIAATEAGQRTVCQTGRLRLVPRGALHRETALRLVAGSGLLIGGQGGNSLANVHDDAALGTLLEPSRERATPPAVASQAAGSDGRAGLPRPPSLPGSRLHL
jgi:hypothetical protein